MNIEVLWFEGCPGHEAAVAILNEAIAATGARATVTEVLVPDQAIARQQRFPGSPTIRVNGRDIQPGYEDDGDYGLRCRMYQTSTGYRGVPEREWIVQALTAGTGLKPE